MDFAVPADYTVKIKSKTIGKYLDITIELKKLWNMKIKVIPIVVSVLGMVPSWTGGIGN